MKHSLWRRASARRFDASYSRRFFSSSATVGGLCAVLVSFATFGAFSNANGAATADARNAATANPPSETLDASKPESNAPPVRWLPDQRVLVGAPPTELDFGEIVERLCAERRFGVVGESGETGKIGESGGNDAPISPKDVELSVVRGGGDVADLSLDGRTLTLAWKPKAVGKTEVLVKAAVRGNDARRAFVSFKAESWAPNYFEMFAAALGGLGLFLFGMKKMSEGLQAIAGSRLRRLVAIVTNNRFFAVGAGLLTTAVIQSSSATTVMTLGFVDGGLMTLKQAIGVIIGTNIGTTTTGWILTLNVGKWGLPLVGVSALTALFVKKETVRNYAYFALGLGLIFFGLKTMSAGLASLPEIPRFADFMRSFEATSISGALKCVFIGCLTTILVQSSSATVAITMTLASIGAIRFESAAALVLGENIGTTSTALLSSIGSTATAKRSAYFHSLFNVLGVCWALCLFFPVLLPFVERLGNASGLDVAGKVALTHTVFNVANAIVFLPFVDLFAGLLTKYVKDKPAPNAVRSSVTGLAQFRDEAPLVAVERSRLETQRMFLDCRALAGVLADLKAANFADAALVDKAFALEQKLDDVQDETIAFVSRLTTRTFSTDLAASAREQIRVLEELESLGDYFVAILKSNLKLKNANVPAPKEIDAGFNDFLADALETLVDLGDKFAERKHREVAAPTRERRDRFVARVKEVQARFLRTMFDAPLEPLAIVAVDYQLNAWRRVYEHLLNVAEALEGPAQATAPPKAV